MKKFGILFVHGITGSNRTFEPLLPLVPDSYDIRMITLEGHGGNALDFSRASMRGWKHQVEESVREMVEKYDTVIAVGHSMGCLLMLEQAAKGALAGLFLMNPALHIRPKLRMLTIPLMAMTGLKNNELTEAAKNASGIAPDHNPFHYYGWTARFIELLKESRRVRNQMLDKVKCPVKVILSGKDESVSLKTGRCFRGMSNAQVLELPHSTHYYYPPADLNRLTAEFTNFINSTTPHGLKV